MTNRGLLIVDVQIDFCEGGALAVAGGNAVAEAVGQMVENRPGIYPVVFASRDWHNPMPDTNGGHFAPDGEAPNFVTTWPVHCVAGTAGAKYHPAIDSALSSRLGRTVEVIKGMGRPDYSAFQGEDVLRNIPAGESLKGRGITALDVVGIATDHCVYQSALDALRDYSWLTEVRILTDYVAGVDATASARALDDLRDMGAQLVTGRP